MASQIAQDFHNRAMLQNKQFVALRIAQGTKSSSPRTLDAKRLQPLYYSNPLPDNSSGSKNRPFGVNKDESGRPDAMMLVAMRQQKGGSNGVIHGGVLRDYKYAQKILQRRKTDVLNIEAAKAALPPVMPPLLELSDVDQLSIRLNSNIQKVIDDVEDGRVDGYTISALKSIPLQLVQILPTLDQNKLLELLNIFKNIDQTINFDNDPTVTVGKALTAMRRYIAGKIIPFIEDAMKAFTLSPNDFVRYITTVAKKYFGELTPIREAEEPEVAIPEESQIRLPPGDMAYSGEFAAPAPPTGPAPRVPPPTARRRPRVATVEEAAPAPEVSETQERLALRKEIKQYIQRAYEDDDATAYLENYYESIVGSRRNQPSTANALRRALIRKIDDTLDKTKLTEYLNIVQE